MSDWRAKLAIVAVIASGSMVIGACGSGTSSTPSGTTGKTTDNAKVASVQFTGSLEDGVPIGYAEPTSAKLTIGYANPLNANENVNVGAHAMQLETQRLGGTFVNIDAKGSPDAQVSAVEQLVAQHVDAIVVLPIDPKGLDPVLKKAHDAGIPVIALEANLEQPDAGPNYTSQIWLRRDYMSYLQAKEAATLLPPGATFGQIGFAVPVPTIERQVSRSRYWAEKFGLTWVGRANNPSDDIAGGEKAMTDLLNQHPDMQGLIAYNEESATGAAAAARAQGKRGLVLIGNNGGSLGFASVRSGRIAATVQFRTPEMARFAVWGAYDAVAGKQIPKTIKTGLPVLVTKANVDTVQTWDDQIQQRYGAGK